MLLDRLTPENQNSTSEKDKYIELFKYASGNITYADDDANPDDYYVSCKEAKRMIASLARNPYLYDNKEFSDVPFDCFTCPKTGGMMVLRLLVRKGRVKMRDFLSDSEANLSHDEQFNRFVEEINKDTVCERRKQIEVMKSVQKVAIDKINTAQEDIECGESILEEVKNE